MNPPTPQQEGPISLAQLRANPKLHSEADEQTQIRIEKGIVDERLQSYFSDPRYRIVLDHNPLTIGYNEVDPEANTTTVRLLPAANLALHRVEMADVPPGTSSSPAQGSIHALHFYVHTRDGYTKNMFEPFLAVVMRRTDEDGHFFRQDAGWALLTWGLEVSFYRYERRSHQDLLSITLEDLQSEITRV